MQHLDNQHALAIVKRAGGLVHQQDQRTLPQALETTEPRPEAVVTRRSSVDHLRRPGSKQECSLTCGGREKACS
jgi:hypothetical protein